MAFLSSFLLESLVVRGVLPTRRATQVGRIGRGGVLGVRDPSLPPSSGLRFEPLEPQYPHWQRGADPGAFPGHREDLKSQHGLGM